MRGAPPRHHHGHHHGSSTSTQPSWTLNLAIGETVILLTLSLHPY